jgi:hypothetical protein
MYGFFKKNHKIEKNGKIQKNLDNVFDMLYFRSILRTGRSRRDSRTKFYNINEPNT